MKPSPFKYSVLTVGIVTALGITGIATAASVDYNEEDAFRVSNKASASYTVDGNDTPQSAESNEVVVVVTETGSFSLVATDGASATDDINENLSIGPVAGDTVTFNHTLTNAGNVADTYTIDVSNATNDDFDYDLNATEITYQLRDAQGTAIGGVQTVANGGQITLEPGQSADIVIEAVASNENRVIGDDGILTVTAQSAYLTGKPGATTTTATNVDNAITETPIYAITKSATTNLGTKNLDLNNDNAFVNYTITVKNDGTADGSDVTIIDELPDGLVAIQPGQPNYQAPSSSVSGGSGGGAASTPQVSADGKTISVNGQNITIGQTVTVTFRAKAADNATQASDFENYARVEDDLNGDGTPDIIDSTDNTIDQTFEDPARPDLGKDTDDGTVSPKNQNRDLTITQGEDKEVPLISQDNGYTYTITNAGTDVIEADQQGEVLFRVDPDPNNTNPNITIDRVFVDTNNNGILDTGETVLTPRADGSYDLNDAVPGGLAAGQSVNIGVLVDTNGSGSNLNGDSDIGGSETINVTVLPQNAVDGTVAPADAETSSTTTMQGLQLYKFQAVADCGIDPTSISTWVDTNLPGEAGQCVYYKLESTNTFTDTAINNIVLTDTLVGALAYQNDYVSDTSGTSATATPTIAGQTIGGRFATLSGQETGNIYFSARISQTGNNATP